MDTFCRRRGARSRQIWLAFFIRTTPIPAFAQVTARCVEMSRRPREP